MTFGALYQWINLLALLISTGVAAWRGRGPERAAAAAMIAGLSSREASSTRISSKSAKL